MDTIERHFASDLLDVIKEKVDKGEPFPYENAKRFIEKLPAAQPEPCEDAVSKETILKFLDGWMSVLDENCHNQSVSDLKIIKRDFENLPTVTPKQRTGKWTDGNPICPVCGEDKFKDLDADIWADWKPKFCPNCGAEMKGDAE